MFSKTKLIRLTLVVLIIAMITGCGFFGDDADDLALEYASIEADGEYYSGLNEIYLEFNNQVASADLALSSSDDGIDFDKDISGERVLISDFELAGDKEYQFNYSVSDEAGSELQGEIEFTTFTADTPEIDNSELNETMYQAFYWNAYPGLWSDIAEGEYDYLDADHLAEVGITSMWLPPAAKAANGTNGTDDVGYAVYDFWDLGEFDQTRYGTRAELEGAIGQLDDLGIDAYYDVVFNHRMGADGTEEVKLASYVKEKNNEWKFIFNPNSWAEAPAADKIDSVWLVGEMQEEDWDENNQDFELEEKDGVWKASFDTVEEGQEFKFMFNDANWDNEVPSEYGNDLIIEDTRDTVKAWTDFSEMQGREKHYKKSEEWEWNWEEFNGVDYDENEGEIDPVLFKGKSWDNTYSSPYLMGADVDYSQNHVREEMKEWGKWITNKIGFAGFRMDAIAHVDNDFTDQWLNHVQDATEDDIFFVAEAWVGDVEGYLDAVGNDNLMAFDFPLREEFVDMSAGDKDMSSWSGLTTSDRSDQAVTFIDNHDTSREGNPYDQPQIENYKNQAYAYILMREESVPTVYARDYDEFGMDNTLDQLIEARKYFAYGESDESASSEQIYVNVRAGLDDVDGTGLVMLLSGRDEGGIQTKEINSQQPNTEFYDYTGNVGGTITTDSDGYAEFKVNLTEAGGWSVWVPKN